MRPLRFSINVTLDGCCDHRAIPTDATLHGYFTDKLAAADALLFGRVTYEMMEEAWRPVAAGERPDWVVPFATTIDGKRKYVASSTLKQVDWNAELIDPDLAKGVEALKREPGDGLLVCGVQLALALTEPGSSTSTRSWCSRGSPATVPRCSQAFRSTSISSSWAVASSIRARSRSGTSRRDSARVVA